MGIIKKVIGLISSFQSLKLRYQIILFIVFSISIVLVIEIYYYTSISRTMQNRMIITAGSMLNQVYSNVEGFSKRIEQSAAVISNNKYVQEMLTEENAGKQIELSKFLFNIMDYIKLVNNDIDNLIISDLDGNYIQMTSSLSDVWEVLKNQYNVLDPDNKLTALYPHLQNKYTHKRYYAYVTPILLSLRGAYAHDKIGCLTILIDEVILNTLLVNEYMTPSSLLFIQDDDGKIIAADKKNASMIGSNTGEDILSVISSGEHVTFSSYMGKESIIQFKRVEKLALSIVSVIPTSEISDDLNPIRDQGVFTAFIMVLVLLFIGRSMNKGISEPIAAFIGFMSDIDHQLGSNIFTKKLPVVHTNEIGQLSIYINRMLDEIEIMTRKIFSTQTSLYEMELLKKQAELTALQSQINPHFLYNTLDCIKGIAHSYNSDEIVSIVGSLSRMLRYSIKSEERVSIRSEIDCIMDYLNIIDIRFMKRFSFELDIDKEIIDLTMIKFILQPIVENAIYHGLEAKPGKGSLTIKGGLRESGNIFFEIADNGKGMTQNELEALNGRLRETKVGQFLTENNGRSIGILNINYRIKNVYGNEYGLSVDSIENNGTKVFIELPINNRDSI